MTKLLPFQNRFISAATRPDVDIACWSAPRGNGKSFLAGQILTRVLTPTDKMFVKGAESILVAGSVEQARICYRFVCSELAGIDGYKYQDSANRIGIRHVATGTRLRVLSSSGKRAMGLGSSNPYIVMDEPGALDTANGELLYEAVTGALGKPGQDTTAIFVGTLAPARAGWWHSLIADGSSRSTYVQKLVGDPEKWDQWNEIRRVNPLCNISPKFRHKLLEERDAARTDSRKKAYFLSYRMNHPTGDSAETLLDVDDWTRVRARPVPAREHRPVVAIDLGQGRSWSAAVAIWPNGRCEAIAVAPGLPNLADQEKRDRVPKGTYQRLADSGCLRMADGVRVPSPSVLVNWIRDRWGIPALVVADRFRVNELRDCQLPCQLITRTTRWSESSEDIRSLRKLAKDGPLAVTAESEPLILWSLTAAQVKNDDQGSMRLTKRDPSNNVARDDVAAALCLVAGAADRRPAPAPSAPRLRIVRRAA